jgi:mannosyl-3-phosphoglycerate phosphatase
LLVFTDLDGTLLDAQTYEWREAADTLNELRRRKVPLILCTSKTVAEVEVIRRRLGIQDPFIAENGGMLVLPWSFLGRPAGPGSIHHPYMVRLGWGYPEVVAVLKRLARAAKVRVRGFNEMTDKEVADATGLGLPEARQAKQRQASEPFRFVDATPAQIRAFRQAAKADGLQVAQGGRFWYLSAGSDKGRAAELLLFLYELFKGTPVQAIAVGDTSIDLPMLRRVELPLLMQRAGGEFDAEVVRALPTVVRVNGSGPSVWARAVHNALRSCERKSAPKLKTPSRAAPADGWQVLGPRVVSLEPAREVRLKPPAGRTIRASR